MQDLDSRFRDAVQWVRNVQSLPAEGDIQISNEEKLRFYGLYKQATSGKITTPKPSFWDVVARAKWDSWSSYSELSNEDAKEEYIDALIEFLKRYPDRPEAMKQVSKLNKSRDFDDAKSEETRFEDANDNSDYTEPVINNVSRTNGLTLVTATKVNHAEIRINRLESTVESLTKRVNSLESSMKLQKKRMWAYFMMIALVYFVKKAHPLVLQLIKSLF